MSKPPSPAELIRLFHSLRRKKLPLVVVIGVVAVSYFSGHLLLPGVGGGASGDTCKVVRVYDGDTVTLQCPDKPDQTKVRLYCIDAPEMQQDRWGPAARDYLRERIDTQVRLEVIDTDRYQRSVGLLYNPDGTNLNLAQVEAGVVAVYDRYCQKPEFKDAEKRAKQAKLGIWARPGLHQTPWDWRKSKTK